MTPLIPDAVLQLIAPVVLAHAIGDYIIQSDWMAVNKVKRIWPATIHGVTYAVPFLLLTRDWRILAIIAGTHVVVDRWRLARYLIWLSNWAAPIRVIQNGDGVSRYTLSSYNPPWAECRVTGFASGRPVWLTVWLMFIVDNLIHICTAIGAFWMLGLA